MTSQYLPIWGKLENFKSEIWFDRQYFVWGPFNYYVIKEVGGWGHKMAIFDDLQYCKSSKKWVGGPKKVKNMMTKYLNGPLPYKY